MKLLESFLPLAFLIAAAVLTSPDSVNGVWESPEHKDLIFHEDGTGTWDGYPFEFYIEGKNIHAKKDSIDYLFIYEISENQLTLDGNTLNTPRAFIKSHQNY